MVPEIIFDDFGNVLYWEIEKMKRFQCPNELCVVFLRPEFENEFKTLKKVVKEVLRRTDLITYVDNNIFLILPGTTKEGAQFISKAIYDFFNKQVVEFYVDYPKDGLTKDEIINSLIKGVEEKYGILLKKYFKNE